MSVYFLFIGLLPSLLPGTFATIRVAYKAGYDKARRRFRHRGEVSGTVIVLTSAGRIQTDAPGGCGSDRAAVCEYRGQPLKNEKLRVFAVARFEKMNRWTKSAKPQDLEVVHGSDQLPGEASTMLPAAAAGLILYHPSCGPLNYGSDRTATDFKCVVGDDEPAQVVQFKHKLVHVSRLFSRLPNWLAVPLQFYITQEETTTTFFGIMKMPISATVDEKGSPITMTFSVDLPSQSFSVVTGKPLNWHLCALGRENYACIDKFCREFFLSRSDGHRLGGPPAWIPITRKLKFLPSGVLAPQPAFMFHFDAESSSMTMFQIGGWPSATKVEVRHHFGPMVPQDLTGDLGLVALPYTEFLPDD